MATPGGRIARKARALLSGRGIVLRRPLRTRSVLLETTATTALYVVVVAVAVAFSSPWLPRPDPAGPALERYQPVRDGTSALFAKLDVSGEVQSWTSQNAAHTPWLALFNELRKAPSEHLLQLYGLPDLAEVSFSEQLRRNEARGQIFTTRRRELDRAGSVTESLVITLRDERGEHLVGFYSAADGDVLFDPPALLLPSDLEQGQSWQGEGRIGTAEYRWSAQATEAGSVEGRVTRFDDCLRVESRFSVVRGQRPLRETIGSDWYCAEIGLVQSEELNIGTGVTTRNVLVGQAGGAADAALLPSASTGRLALARPAGPTRRTTWAILAPGP
jgi:hypothetical protein